MRKRYLVIFLLLVNAIHIIAGTGHSAEGFSLAEINQVTVDGIIYRLYDTGTAEVNGIDTTVIRDGVMSIPEFVTSNNVEYLVNEIDFGIMDRSISSLSIPATVSKIYPPVFWGLPNLEHILVAKDNPIYDSRDNCNAIIETKTNTLLLGCKNTTIPFTVEKIGAAAFFNCVDLTSITIPGSVSTISSRAFENCEQLKQIIIPYGVKEIGIYAFAGCKELQTVIFSNTVTEIKRSVFKDCEKLEKVYISNTVTSIGNYAFGNCKRLKNIYVPNSVNEIGENVFDKCDSLEFVMIPYNEKGMSNCLFSDQTPLSNFVLSVPHTNSELSKFKADWWDKITNVVIESGVKELREDAFYYNSKIKNIIIPNSIKNVGAGALYHCDSIKIYTTCKTQILDKAFYSSKWSYKDSKVDKRYYTREREQIKGINYSSLKELVYCQPFTSYSTPIITQRLIDWVEQREGERTPEWKLRVTEESIQKKEHEIYSEIEEDYIRHNLPKYSPSFSIGPYDPETQNFIFIEKNYGQVMVHVPNAEAEYVDKNWNGKIINCSYCIIDDEIRVKFLTIFLPNGRTYSTK